MFVLTKVMILFLLLVGMNVNLADQIDEYDLLKNFTKDLDEKYIEKEMNDYQDEEQVKDYPIEEIETKDMDYYLQSLLKVVDIFSREVSKRMLETKYIINKKKAKEYEEIGGLTLNDTLADRTLTKNIINIYAKGFIEVINSCFGYFFGGSAPKFKNPNNLKSLVAKLVGDSVRLRCLPESQPKQTILWYQNYTYPVNMDGWKTYKKWTLIKLNLTKMDTANYTCVICNKFACINRTYELRIQDRFSEDLYVKKEKIITSGEMATIFYAFSSALAILIVIFLMALFIFKNKLEKEKMKREYDVEKDKAATVTHCRNVITVAKSSNYMPVVKLEKQNLHQVQCASTILDMIMPIQYKLPLDLSWEVPRKTLSLGKEVGEGEFGKVLTAYCSDILVPGLKSVVAVKMLKEGYTEDELLTLVSEMEMLKIIGKHMNIINLLGCCTQDGPFYIIMEYAANGSLKDFLRRHRITKSKEHSTENKTLTMKDLVSYSYQITKGMEYLALKKCIHRDLAARNVLVSENYVIKIADFGLAKDVHSNYYYRKKTEGKLPVRWMAPEALLEKCFTTKSDVWSFGVLLWEIMTLGGTPYPTVPGQYMYQHLSAGHRMEKPPLCSDAIYNIMSECWTFEPEGRPTFTQLVEDLDQTLTELAAQEYLDLEDRFLAVTPSLSECGAGDEDGY